MKPHPHLALVPSPAAEPASRPTMLPPRPPARAIDASKLGYATVEISMYIRERDRLDAMVAELRRRGYRVTRSSLVRVALDQLDLDRVPRGT